MDRARRVSSIVLLFVLIAGAPSTTNLSRANAQSIPPRYSKDLIGVLNDDAISVAFAISSGGWVTGRSSNTQDGTNRVIRYRDGKLLDRSNGEDASFAWAINKSAQMAGFIGTSPTTSVAAVWDGSDRIRLPALGGESSQAFGINDDGVVVGGSQAIAGRPYHACWWVNGEAEALPSRKGWVLADAINKQGQIVGSVSPSSDPTAPGGRATL